MMHSPQPHDPLVWDEDTLEAFQRKEHLLIIAIDKYKDSRISNLENAERDAKAVAELLKSQYRFDSVETLCGEKATKKAIVNTLHSYGPASSSTLTKNDNLIIFFSGHGLYKKEREIGYWMPYDADMTSPDSWLKNSSVRDEINGINCFHCLVISDSCFSSSLFIPQQRDANGIIKAANRAPSVALLAAGAMETVSDGIVGRHSPFTTELLNCLNQASEYYTISALEEDLNKRLGASDSPLPVYGQLFKRREVDLPGKYVFFQQREDEKDWKICRKKNNQQAYQQYLGWHTRGKYADNAQAFIDALKLRGEEKQLDSGELKSLKLELREANILRKEEKFAFNKFKAEYAEKEQKLLVQIEKLNTSESTYQQLKEQLSTKQNELASLQAAHTQLKAECSTLQKTLAKKEASLSDLEEQVRSSEAKLQAMEEPNALTAALPKDMVFVESGSFMMGDVLDDNEQADETPHPVAVSSFAMSKYALTFDEYDAFCEASKRNKPSDEGWGRGKRPVINVSWYDVVAYCNWRSEQEGFEKVYSGSGEAIEIDYTVKGYRLPTEAEWEYAARERGKDVRFGNGQNIANALEMNFNATKEYKKMYSEVGEYRVQTVPVHSFEPNALGLYNMSGNVWEWCNDHYAESYYQECLSASNNKSTAFSKSAGSGPLGTASDLLDAAVQNPRGAASIRTGNARNSFLRLLRGGSWYDEPGDARVAIRARVGADSCDSDFSARLVLALV